MNDRRSARTPFLLVAIAMLALAGCRGPKVPKAISPAGEVTNDQRLAAMISVHAHARWGMPASFPEDVRTISLPEAAGILLADKSPLGRSRLWTGFLP